MDPSCISQVKSKRIALGDKGSAYKAYIANPDGDLHDVIRVDGCVIKNEEAADWIVRKDGVGAVIIEIKGSNVSKALQQLISTYNHVGCKPALGPKCGFLIVCSRMPQVDTSIQRAMSKIRSIGKLRVICRGGEFLIDSLL